VTSLRVLITNCTLAGQSGTEMYVYDVALRLLARGHRPIVYSPQLGPVAQRLSAATVSVVTDLARVQEPPDIIHGHHSMETLQALLHFPAAPAIYVCHDWNGVHDMPPKLPRVRRFIAVDETVRDRLTIQEGIAAPHVEVIYNGVDLDRFQPRPPLPARPRKALAISNYLEPQQVEIIAAACRSRGIELDAIGAKLGGSHPHPESVLGQYDIVFAKARCAWESLAVGTAVIVCDTWGLGPLVTTAELASLRSANFGRRLLQRPLRADVIADELARYDASDAAEVSWQIRATASVEQTVDRLLQCYDEVIREHRAAVPDLAADMRAAAEFLRHWPSLHSPAAVSVHAPINRVRWIIRDELQRNRRTSGLRKLWRSIQKRWPLTKSPRRAA
jgi:glycosyl transferase family 4